ncbi:hypothetical protein D910_07870 [Dendroctonus ponderosae]|uniref:Uncharacterized protein n=1 Tax=Dendroctonus ponderosae TaxID=77166 RepID=U4UBT6_DENPD|nr:hypothetical protein D910_07870 [Dendroctonus ponderosae]
MSNCDLSFRGSLNFFKQRVQFSEFIMSAETELSMQSGLQSVLLPPDLTTLSLIGHRPPAQGPHLGHLPPAHPMSQTNGLCIAWKLPGACFLVRQDVPKVNSKHQAKHGELEARVFRGGMN